MKTILESMLRDKTTLQMLYRTGLRVSELSNLKKYDLDLNSYEAVIDVGITNEKGEKDRIVCIDQETVELLRKMIYKRTRKGKKDKTDYLFTARTDNQLKLRDIERIVKKYAIKPYERLKRKK